MGGVDHDDRSPTCCQNLYHAPHPVPAGTTDLTRLRRYEVSDLGRYEEEMLGSIRTRHAEILGEIRETAQLPDELAEKLAAALDEFAEIFQPSKATAEASEAA